MSDDNRPVQNRAQKILGAVVSPDRYSLIIIASLAFIAYRLVYQFHNHDMRFIYLEYLANYDLGFIRRGLIPELLSFWRTQLTHLDVKIFAAALICLTVVSYLAMYAVRCGLRSREWPLLAFTLASPCVFKNFLDDFARLDAFGFLGGVIALMLPLNAAYAPILGLICCVLILIHEAQFLTYIPAIVCIAAIRTVAAKPEIMRGELPWREGLALLAVGVTFLLVTHFGSPRVPPDQLWAHLQSRATDPVIDRVFLWYIGPLTNMQMANTADYLWPQLFRIQNYALLLAIHLPLFIFARRRTRDTATMTQRVIVLGAIVVTICFTVMFVISHDKARWFANWMSGLILILHAVRVATPANEASDAILRRPVTVGAAWLATVIKRVGLMTPL